MPFHQPQHIFSFLFPSSSSSSSSSSFVKHRVNIHQRLIALTLSLPWHCTFSFLIRVNFCVIYYSFVVSFNVCPKNFTFDWSHISLVSHFYFCFTFDGNGANETKFNRTNKRQSEINEQMEILLFMGDRKSFARQKILSGSRTHTM